MNRKLATPAGLALIAVLAGCDQDSQPLQHIYRYPQGATPPVALLSAGPGTRVDHHNHALAQPGQGQHWQLRPGAFALVNADGSVAALLPATYMGR